MADVFLLNPKNQAFLDGRDKIPKSARPMHWGSLAIAVFLVSCLLAVVGYFWYDLRLLQHLRANGVETTASVLKSTIHETIEDDSGHITFRYQAKVGDERRDFTHTLKTRPETASRYRTGSRMRIVHDPTNPNIVRIADELKMEPHPEFPGDHEFLGLKIICVILGGTAFMSACVWFGRGLLPYLRMRRQPGRLLVGEVVERTGRSDDNDVYYVYVDYRFQTPEGKTLHDSTDAVRRDDLSPQTLPAPGTPVHVYYVDDSRYWCL